MVHGEPVHDARRDPGNGRARHADPRGPPDRHDRHGDIGAEAARRLAALDFDGHHIKELLGPRDYTLNEIAAIVGEAIGQPDLPYVTVPEEAAAAGFEQMGVHPATVASFMEMYRGFGDGRVVPLESRSAANTTPTTLEEFSGQLAAAYAASA